MGILAYPIYKGFKEDGSSIAAGYKLHTYYAGTLLPKPVYIDDALTTEATNPVTLDNMGEAYIFLGTGKYRLDLMSPDGALVNTCDFVQGKLDYEEGTFTLTLVGCTTSPTVTVKWVRFGNKVVLIIPHVSATSNTTGLSFSGLPVALRPKTAQYLRGFDGLDNNTFYPFVICVSNSTSIGVYKQASFSAVPTATFTSGNEKGMSTVPWTICYSLL